MSPGDERSAFPGLWWPLPELLLWRTGLTLHKYAGDAGGISNTGPAATEDGTDMSDAEDVESSIQKELESLKPSASSLSLWKLVKLDIQCGRLSTGFEWCLPNEMNLSKLTPIKSRLSEPATA